MPYTIKKFNGQTLTVIEDGTVDTTSTNLNLPGKNYSGYGLSLNESLVYLLENFANSTEPSRKLTGQLWFDSVAKKIKVYDGTKFRSLGSIEYGTTAPSNQVIGDQWFNTTTNQLFVWNGTTHKLIGPLQVGATTSQLVSKKLLDSGGNTQTVLQAVVGATVTAIFSETEFDINSNQTPVEGYSHINKGITIPSRDTYPNMQFAGIARAADYLKVSPLPLTVNTNAGEVHASNFVQKQTSNVQTITSSVIVGVSPDTDVNGNFTNNRGLFVGSTQDLYLSALSGVGYITNLTGDNITLSVQTSGAVKKIVVVQSDNFAPSIDNNIDLGTSAKKWKNVYGYNFFSVDNPSNPGSTAFNGKVNGTTVNASVGFFGNLTGDVKGKILSPTGAVVVDNTSATAAYTGKTTGDHYGNVYNLNVPVQVQKAVDTTAVDVDLNPITLFRGTLRGTADLAIKVKVGLKEYPGLESSLDYTAYYNTIALRDNNGRISANEFDGVATRAATLIYGGIGRTADTNPVGGTIVVRDEFGNINAGTISGKATDSAKLNNAIDSVPAQPNTIVKRDANSDVFANLFQGVAVQANYADLAEKYLADQEYAIGTVVMIGGEKEVTASAWGKRAIGVVSGNPAYLMNKDLEGGTAIALKGRVPVKVIGSVKKGDDLIASDNGYAVSAVPHSSRVFAVALESNSDTGVKIVECLIL